MAPNGISQVGVSACEWLDGDADGTCCAVGMVAGEGSFQGGEETRVEVGVSEDLTEVGWSAEVDSGGCFKEIVYDGVWVNQC